jgi:hypoxanthine phosphoribosyltransferase
MAHVNDGHLRATYQDIHLTIAKTAAKIKKEFNPDIMIAIGGGGFFPARVLRTYLKSDEHKNIPIQAIGLSLYEDLGHDHPSSEEVMNTKVTRTQWLDFSTLGDRPLLGRALLIVDEVDDSRTTLSYAVTELQKDIDLALARLSDEERRLCPPTKLGIFVVHNKLKEKAAAIPDNVAYFAGEDVSRILSVESTLMSLGHY